LFHLDCPDHLVTGAFPSIPEVEKLPEIVRNRIREGSVESGCDGIPISESDFVGSFHDFSSVVVIYIICEQGQMSIDPVSGRIEVSPK